MIFYGMIVLEKSLHVLLHLATSKKELAKRMTKPPTVDALYGIPVILDHNIRRGCTTEVTSKGKNILERSQKKERIEATTSRPRLSNLGVLHRQSRGADEECFIAIVIAPNISSPCIVTGGKGKLKQ